jgi:hypothetical protein
LDILTQVCFLLKFFLLLFTNNIYYYHLVGIGGQYICRRIPFKIYEQEKNLVDKNPNYKSPLKDNINSPIFINDPQFTTIPGFRKFVYFIANYNGGNKYIYI